MSSDDIFHELVSELSYPMFIVTAAAGTERAGCLVGFATQASIDPPRLLVFLSKSNRTYKVAEQARVLAVHFLNRDNEDLATAFGEATGDDSDKFANREWIPGPDGTPLLPGTRGWITGTILDRMDAGDHVAHLLTIDSAKAGVAGEQLGFQSVRNMEPGHPAR
jgi:flavin reductase (DIM6/NTAB) family NADH-FMN oxidoreductase RutF